MQNYVYKRQVIFVITAMVLIFVSLPACYTLLRHPTVIKEEYTDTRPNDCRSCHEENDLWRFHHPGDAFVPGAAFYDPWVYYYEIPWWYESYWFYDDSKHPETVPLRRRSLRSSEEKRGTTKMRGSFTHPTTDVKIKGQSLKSQEKKREGSKSKKEKKRSLRGKWKKGKKDANNKKQKKNDKN